ncbi:helix-turn-helix domain-containing protein [Brevibacillus borstelensis]|uniref:helix-turn-helix domain-containing protein n=1 Tax=Brevibacillus borstelensis TaxID=45462 RepID=UPI003CE45E62
MTLGDKLKSLREQRGWTQSQAAERLGISSQVVSNYERDYRSPDKETLSRIAKVYNCSLDWLLGVADNPERIDDPSPSDKKDKPEDELTTIMYHKWDQLDERRRKQALKLLEILEQEAAEENKKS